MSLRRRGSRLGRAVHWGLFEEVLVVTAGRLPDSTPSYLQPHQPLWPAVPSLGWKHY